MKINLRKVTNKQIFTVGFIAVLLSFIPYMILGTDAVIPYHDQLDVELINYIYQAKYLFSGDGIIPEFLSGASKTAMTPPAPLAVLLFKICPPFIAYMVLQVICQITSYVGMYALAREFTDKGMIAAIVSLFFTYNAFFVVHGLSVYGTPMLVLCIMYLYRGEHKIWSFFYVALYAMMSSLVLCGFAWLGFLLLFLIILAICGQLKAHKELVYGFCMMLGIYIAENMTLLGQMFGFVKSSVSHKAELVINSEPVLDAFLRYFKYNDEHTQDHHMWIIGLVLFVVVLLCCYKKFGSSSTEQKKILYRRNLMIGIFLAICLIYFGAALWSSSVCVAVRKQLGALKAFNFSRIFWVTPVLWYIELTLCLETLWSFRGLWKRLAYLITIPVLLWNGFFLFKDSMIKPCIQEILLPDYDAISFSDYYAIGVMNQVEAHIKKQDGRNKEEYKVASLGIDPAAALYHGFYCIDGYSNNYDLEYKHKFRKIIAPELERNEWLKSYFDDWGNRCYLFFSEIPGYFNIEKDTSWINELRLDTDALQEMGCDYIFSALYIVNAEEIGLEWMDDITFDTEDSYYQIFIYKVNGKVKK